MALLQWRTGASSMLVQASILGKNSNTLTNAESTKRPRPN